MYKMKCKTMLNIPHAGIIKIMIASGVYSLGVCSKTRMHTLFEINNKQTLNCALNTIAAYCYNIQIFNTR